MDALTLLRKDHSAVKLLFSKFDRISKTDHDRRSELFAQIRRELQLHSRAEEQIFYPALKALNGAGQRLASQALKEHEEIDTLLIQISRLKPSDKNFDDNFEMLLESMEYHVEEEEGEIFQFAEENCSAQELEELGNQIEQRRRFLDREMAA